MSVEYCVIRLGPKRFAELLQHPDHLADLVDEYYSQLLEPAADADCVDARAAYSGEAFAPPHTLRMLYCDEFTTSLLVSFMDNEQTPFYHALVGWETAQPLLGSSYGHGEARYYEPREVSRVAGA